MKEKCKDCNMRKKTKVQIYTIKGDRYLCEECFEKRKLRTSEVVRT